MNETRNNEGLLNDKKFNGIIILLKESHTDEKDIEESDTYKKNSDSFWFKTIVTNYATWLLETVSNISDNKKKVRTKRVATRFLNYFNRILAEFDESKKLCETAFFNLKNWGIGGATESKEYKKMIENFHKGERYPNNEDKEHGISFEERLFEIIAPIKEFNRKQNLKELTILTVKDIYELLKEYAEKEGKAGNLDGGFKYERGAIEYSPYNPPSFKLEHDGLPPVRVHCIYHPTARMRFKKYYNK